MEGKDKAKRFMEEMSLTFPTLLDVKGEVTRLFNVYALPSSFFIDKKGRVRGVAYGAREWDGDGAVKIIEQLLGEV
jgi:peroxiredoxin